MYSELEIGTKICPANLSEYSKFVLPFLDFDLTLSATYKSCIYIHVYVTQIDYRITMQNEIINYINTYYMYTNPFVTHIYVMCKLLLRHNGRPNNHLIRQKHEMVRKCPMSDCYFQLCILVGMPSSNKNVHVIQEVGFQATTCTIMYIHVYVHVRTCNIIICTCKYTCTCTCKYMYSHAFGTNPC